MIFVRINGFFKRGPFEAAYVVAIFSSRQLDIRGTIEFIIDTGASRTTISDRDAIKLGIDYSKLEKLPEGTLGIGGSVDTYIVSQPELIFVTSDGKHHVEKLDRIYVLKHRRVDEKIKRIPSILGRDVLNKYIIIFDRKRERAVITDETL